MNAPNVTTKVAAATSQFRLTRRVAIGVLALVALGVAVGSLFAEGGANGFDRGLMLALRNPADLDDPVGPGWFEDVMRDFTGLGGIAVVVGASLLLCGYLLLRRRYADIAILATSLVGAQLLSSLAKLVVSRPRPDLVSHEAQIYSASFPSGHSLMSSVAYATFALLLVVDVDDRRVRELLLVAAWLVSLAVGCSRIYLGVHWPSDVLAGWAVGALWMLLMLRLWPRLNFKAAS
jgi:undecaprenyl-diphosphatase